MTVCVAAICNNHTILGASDRMLTAGNIQFEPQQSKIVALTTAIAVMMAGDSAMQAEVMQNVNADVYRRIESEPKNWWNVRDVAEIYSRYYNQARLKRAENAILAPLGLNSDTFISRQRELDSTLVRQLSTELLNFESPVVETIFAGIDTTGAHIYVIRNSNISCLDHVGFASIGAGAYHADSQFMFAGHTRQRPLPATLLLVYSAKKRAEVAPGVGEGTDMFTVGPALSSFATLREEVIDRLEDIYKDTRKLTQEAIQKSEERTNQYVEEISRAGSAKDQAAVPEDGGGNAPSDQKELPDGSPG